MTVHDGPEYAEGDADADTPFVRVPSTDLNRILSNVITNAVEACKGTTEPRISISVTRKAQLVIVRVDDNGVGISEHLQSHIFESGFTTKSDAGHGDGLPSAKERARQANGDVRLVSSRTGVGTSIEIVLPWIATPSWFVDRFQIKNTSVVVIVDDEDLAFDYWDKTIKDRFAFDLHGSITPTLLHIKSPTALKTAAGNVIERATHFLVDQHFENDSQTGLQLIEELGLQERATLVTNLFESESVTDEAIRLGVRILPKPHVLNARISIELEEQP